ncbi:33644_t:CDS:2 [Gigaspora margarita]|uniref:33644_t:CDS:1 n=1 Tax=Gigaspora margarita TaxID=4874 RepID=A0ABM8VXK6_GIGMA|nr:33644_t:CDS:2 [Gigaspora margarita]
MYNLKRLIDKLTINKDTLTGTSYPLAKDGSYMYTDDINFLSVILKRPLRVLYFPKKEQFTSGDEWKEEVEIYFEPIAPVKIEEIMVGLMVTYKMTVEVSERGEYRNEGTHLIEMINTYGEDDDPHPGSLAGLENKIKQTISTFKDEIIHYQQVKIELEEQINLLETELKGEKQMNESQIKVYQQKINALKTIISKSWENKPKREIEVQTDLTIPKENTRIWLEKDIAKHEADIQKEQDKVSKLQNKLSNLREDLKNLKTTELETGQTAFGNQWDYQQLRPPYIEVRNKLLELVQSLIEGKETQEQLEKRNKELEEKLKVGDLNAEEKKLMKLLRPDYENIRQKLIQLCQAELEKDKLQSQIQTLTQAKTELQTKLDLATKTKEELAQEKQVINNELSLTKKELQKEKGWWDEMEKEKIYPLTLKEEALGKIIPYAENTVIDNTVKIFITLANTKIPGKRYLSLDIRKGNGSVIDSPLYLKLKVAIPELVKSEYSIKPSSTRRYFAIILETLQTFLGEVINIGKASADDINVKMTLNHYQEGKDLKELIIGDAWLFDNSRKTRMGKKLFEE